MFHFGALGPMGFSCLLELYLKHEYRLLLFSTWWMLLLVMCNRAIPRQRNQNLTNGGWEQVSGSWGKESPATSTMVRELWASGLFWWGHSYSSVNMHECTQEPLTVQGVGQFLKKVNVWERTILCWMLCVLRITSLLRACSGKCNMMSHPNFIANLWNMDQMDNASQLKSTVWLWECD